MTNKFTRNGRSPTLLRHLLPPLLLLLFVCLAIHGVNRIEQTAQQEQLQTMQSAVVRAAVRCYAIEGAYPSNLGYLQEHYGLQVDEGRYIVHYELFASNIFPQIAVFAQTSAPASDGPESAIL